MLKRPGTIFLFILLSFNPFLLLGGNDSVCKPSDSVFHRRITILPVPAFGYSPETSTYVGAVALMTLHLFDDSLTRTSNAKIEFNYTLKKQYITDLGWEIYTRKERYYYKGRMTFSRYPDLYYGTGNNTALSNEIHYDSRRTVAEIHALRSLSGKHFFGFILRFNSYHIIDDSSESVRRYPELHSSRSGGLGLRYMTDKRNSLLNCTQGRYSDFSVSVNHSNHSDYLKLGADIRYYKTYNNIHTFAIRLSGLFTLNDPAPFYDLALIGGDSQVRGYLSGRYRDNNLITLQPEFRSLIYRRWGYAIFGGITQVTHDLKDAEIALTRINYGLGLRFMIDRKERTNLRFDYARGTDGSDGFYISFGEAF